MQNDASKPRTVIVTGSNRGIGYSIIEGLVAGPTPYHIILTSRTLEKGQQAADKLKAKYPESSSTITVQELDIIKSESIENFAFWVRTTLRTIDVLINNAGCGDDEQPLETLLTNFHRTVEITDKLLPLLSHDGKIIIISSRSGSLYYQPPKSKVILNDPSLTKEKIFEQAEKFRKAVEASPKKFIFEFPAKLTDPINDDHEDFEVWDYPYATSKALLNAWVRWVLVKEVKEGQQVYSVCPGSCSTDMGGPNAPRTPEQGADTPIYLTNLPFEVNANLQGKFLRDREVRGFDELIPGK